MTGAFALVDDTDCAMFRVIVFDNDSFEDVFVFEEVHDFVARLDRVPVGLTESDRVAEGDCDGEGEVDGLTEVLITFPQTESPPNG